jgi:hypothetical protein
MQVSCSLYAASLRRVESYYPHFSPLRRSKLLFSFTISKVLLTSPLFADSLRDCLFILALVLYPEVQIHGQEELSRVTGWPAPHFR